MGLERLLSLPISVDDVAYSRHESATSSGFDRVTTEVRLLGRDDAGRGEDLSYEPADHERLGRDPPALPVDFEGRLSGYLGALEEVDLTPHDPDRASLRRFRRWAVESAAIDLALRQAGTDLAERLDRRHRPVRFVASTRLGDPPAVDRLRAYRRADPNVAFKLDPTPAWTSDLIEAVAELGGVAILDLKGRYGDEEVGQPPDAERYGRLLEAFPEAIVEDPAVTEATRSIVADAADRIAWDAPISAVDDVPEQPISPAWLNVKPSRIGGLQSLFDVYEYCRTNDIGMYGGGQFELGAGRSQIQALASLWHPDAPNDVAPRAYNRPTVPDDLPTSPLPSPDRVRGFGWSDGPE